MVSCGWMVAKVGILWMVAVDGILCMVSLNNSLPLQLPWIVVCYRLM
jgi:hypothetical protein